MIRFSNRLSAVLLALALLVIPMAAHAAPATDTGTPSWGADLLELLGSMGAWLEGVLIGSTDKPTDGGDLDPASGTTTLDTTTQATTSDPTSSEGETTGNYDPNG